MRLVEEKERLLGRVEEINRSLDHFPNGATGEPAQGTKRGRRGRKTNGGLRESILKVLSQQKDSKGLTVRQIAEQGKLNRASVSQWIYTASKGVEGFKKAGKGKVRLSVAVKPPLPRPLAGAGMKGFSICGMKTAVLGAL